MSVGWCAPYKREFTLLGELKTPTFLIIFRRGEKILKAEMLLDTGADCSMAPRMLADVLGLKLTDGFPISVYWGFGEKSKAYVHKFEFSITKKPFPIAISEREDMPFLLGRLGLVGEVDVRLEKEVTCIG